MINIVKLKLENITYLISLRDSNKNSSNNKEYLSKLKNVYLSSTLQDIKDNINKIITVKSIVKDLSKYDIEKRINSEILKASKKENNVKIVKLHEYIPKKDNTISKGIDTNMEWNNIDFELYSKINNNFSYKPIEEESNSCVLGIDTGKSGALVLINKDRKIVYKSKIPIFHGEKGLNYDEQAINLTLLYLKKFTKKVAIEQVHSIFKTSKNTSFLMGYGLGIIRGVLAGNNFKIENIPPKSWQNIVWSPSDYIYNSNNKSINTKKTSLMAAKRIFSGEDFKANMRQRNPDDGIVDAALIAISKFL